jgi:Cu2+-exporting ATPase
LTVAAGALAREGLLVTRSHAIETLARATHVVFDKTGTLTTGRLSLVDVLPFSNLGARECLALAAAIEHASEHPIGAALRAAAGALPDKPAALDATVNEPGAGISAKDGARTLRIGKPAYVAALCGQALPAAAAQFVESGDTVIALGDEAGWLALFRFADEVRPQALAMSAALRAEGRTLVLLTGDALPAARRVAQSLAIAVVEAGASPQMKHDYVRALQANGAIVAMVGDGVNDAPVLAAAQVSVAMGGGSELARTQADLVLLSDNLGHLASAASIARRSLRIVRQNLVWAFAYNIVALPLAMAGWVSPWLAGVGMSGSSLLVVLNSLRLQRGKK